MIQHNAQNTIGVLTKNFKLDIIINELSNILSNDFKIVAHTTNKCDLNELNKLDLILTLEPELKSLKIENQQKILLSNLTFYEKDWIRIIEIPEGSKAYVVHEDINIAYKILSLLYDLGAFHLKLYPLDEKTLYEKTKSYKNGYAIIMDNIKLKEFSAMFLRVVNLTPVIDLSTVLEVLARFNSFTKYYQNVLLKYTKKIVTINKFLQTTLSWLGECKTQMGLVIDLMQEGVIIIDLNKKITFINKQAEEMLSSKAWKLMGYPLETVVPSMLIKKVETSFKGNSYYNQLAKINDNEIMTNILPVKPYGIVTGVAITLRNITDIKKADYQYQIELKSKGLTAKYCFI